jgi:hypothetical protein
LSSDALSNLIRFYTEVSSAGAFPYPSLPAGLHSKASTTPPQQRPKEGGKGNFIKNEKNVQELFAMI